MAETSLLSHVAIILLGFTATIFCQDNRMLIENCDWPATMWVIPRDGNNVTVKVAPDGSNLVSNLICRTRLYINVDNYILKVKVNKFDLLGPDDCRQHSETMTLLVTDMSNGNKNVSWCGKKYATDLYLPVSAVDLFYFSGAYGEGSGFELEFSAVPQYSCLDQTNLIATTQPMLLYSPNFPGHYKNKMNCSVVLTAEADQYIKIQSHHMDIESAVFCKYDALIINGEKYCGDQQIDLILRSSTVNIQFYSDENTEKTGFILEYLAMKVVNVKYNVMAQTVSVATEMSVIVLPIKPFSSSPWHLLNHLTLDTGSDDTVLTVLFPSDALYYKGIVQKVKTDPRRTVESTGIFGSHPVQINGSLFYRFLRTEGRQKTFSINLTETEMLVIVQAVDKVSLPYKLNATYSLVWVPGEFVSASQQTEMLITADYQSDLQEIEIGVFDRMPADMMHSDLSRRNVADYLKVYNGEDASYFDLIQGCSYVPREDKAITSIHSRNLTVVIKRNPPSAGFWLYIGPINGFSPPAVDMISYAGHFKSNSIMSFKNLYCSWRLYQNQQTYLDLYKDYLFKLKAECDFSPGVAENYFLVAEPYFPFDDKSTIMSYNKYTRKNVWLFAEIPTYITVSMFNLQANGSPGYFYFLFDYIARNEVESINNLEQTLVASRNYQRAHTSDYPNFSRSAGKKWTIQKNQSYDRNSSIIIEFLDFSSLSCSNGSFQILARNSIYQSFYLVEDICDKGPVQKKSYDQLELKVSFTSSSEYFLQGMEFAYYTTGERSYNNCNENITLSNGEKYALYGYVPASENRIPYCNYYIYPMSYNTQLILSVKKLNSPNEQSTYCTRAAAEVYIQQLDERYYKTTFWKLADKLCEGYAENKVYTYTQTAVWISLHLPTTGDFILEYEMEMVMLDSSCEDVNLIATDTVGYIASPNYPNSYPIVNKCTWVISSLSASSVIIVDVLNFDLDECSKQSVDIYDGPNRHSSKQDTLCNYVTKGRQYRSTGKSMTITFNTVWGTTDGGFRFKYWAEDAGSSSSSSGVHDSTVIIIATIFGGIFCALLILGTVIFVWRRKKQRTNPRNRPRSLTSRARPPRTYSESGSNNNNNNSLFIVSPVIISSSMSPPSYAEVMGNHQHHASELPPYSMTETSRDDALPTYSPRWENYAAPDHFTLDPPPYSADLPGGPTHQPYLGVSIPRQGSTSDSPEESPRHHTETLERNAVLTDAPTTTSSVRNVATAPPLDLHQSFHSSAGDTNNSSNDRQTENPPAYSDNESFVHNERGTEQDSRQTPSQIKNGHLGPL